MKSKQEIIREIVSYYENNDRAIDIADGSCYKTKSGRRCSIGLVMNNPKPPEEDSIWNKPVNQFTETGFQRLLKPEYKNHDLSFWTDIQNLHDWDYLWNRKSDGGNRLSKYGANYVNDLMEKYR